MVFAGAVAKQILAQRGIYVGAHIRQIGPVEDERFDPVHTDPALFQTLAEKTFPTLSDLAGERMRKEIYDARERMDSVGGAIECAVVGMPAGLAARFRMQCGGHSVQHLFAVPAVKAVEFGAGFGFAPCTVPRPMTADHGGGPGGDHHQPHRRINGGITTACPLSFSVALRPTASISQPQQTISLSRQENAELVVHGRHDPCVVHRAVPVIEAAAALAMTELL